LVNINYEKFTQYYLEITNILNALEDEAWEKYSVGEEIPHDLANEIQRHIFIKDILTQLGEEKYNKSAHELINDSWNMWYTDEVNIVLIQD
jgi:hypothetical protein